MCIRDSLGTTDSLCPGACFANRAQPEPNGFGLFPANYPRVVRARSAYTLAVSFHWNVSCIETVSYTHLDVYKRQGSMRAGYVDSDTGNITINNLYVQ